MTARQTARALRHRNFRLFFLGQGVSLVGTWVTRIATSWLVWRLTHSEWDLGLVSFAGLAPTLLLGPVGGVFADRFSRHRLLLLTQLLSMLQSGALAFLAFRGEVSFAHLLWLQTLQGFIGALDTPVRQAFVAEIVTDRADLPNAIALNSAMFNASRLVGPALGGALLAAAGEAWCFAVDTVSYAAVILSLVVMRVPHVAARAPQRGDVGRDLREGFRYAREQRAVRTLLLLVAGISLLGTPYSVLLPSLATDALKGGANALGWLMTAAGAGALVSTTWLAGRASLRGVSQVMLAAALTFSAGLLLLAVMCAPLGSYWGALATLPLIGGGLVLVSSSANSLLQTVVPAALRGRVMALYATAFLGMAPLGSVIAGGMAARIGAPWVVAASGALSLLVVAWYARALPAMRTELQQLAAARAQEAAASAG